MITPRRVVRRTRARHRHRKIDVRACAGRERADVVRVCAAQIEKSVRAIPDERAGDVRDSCAARVAGAHANLKRVGAGGGVVALEGNDVPRDGRYGQTGVSRAETDAAEEDEQTREPREERRAAAEPRATQSCLGESLTVHLWLCSVRWLRVRRRCLRRRWRLRRIARCETFARCAEEIEEV